ncbi:MAG: hypothetical protein U9N09_08495 [Euryarchaeota archaeon]|nr:hypothetical protein [Euryarchaeota archaeon]
MGEIEFPDAEEESGIFGNMMRPRMIMDLFSIPRAEWLPIDDVLADTGADLSVLPRFIGELLVEDTTDGKYGEIKGHDLKSKHHDTIQTPDQRRMD